MKSPVLQHFKSNREGKTSIRAYGAMEKEGELQERKLNAYMRVDMSANAVNMWKASRLGMLCSGLTLCASLFAILASGQMSSAILGMALKVSG